MTTFMLSPSEIIAHQKKEIALLQAELVTKDAIIESLSRIEIVGVEERQEWPTLLLHERHGELWPTTGASTMASLMPCTHDILREAVSRAKQADKERVREERLRRVRAQYDRVMYVPPELD